jgi:hypothetical protein
MKPKLAKDLIGCQKYRQRGEPACSNTLAILVVRVHVCVAARLLTPAMTALVMLPFVTPLLRCGGRRFSGCGLAGVAVVLREDKAAKAQNEHQGQNDPEFVSHLSNLLLDVRRSCGALVSGLNTA